MLKRLRKEKVDTFLSVDEVLEEVKRIAKTDLYYHNLCETIDCLKETDKGAYKSIREEIASLPIQDKLDILLYL